jgi:hypothetical protein
VLVWGSDLLVLGRITAGAPTSASGQISVTWPGGAPISNTATVAHGLNGTPTVTGSLNSQAGTGFCFVEISANSANVAVRLKTEGTFTPAGTTVSPVSWRAEL